MPFAKMQNKNIFFEDIGKGPAILFVHPPGMGRKTFIKQKILADEFRIILPDLSGHGDSPSTDEKISIHRYIEEIEAIRTMLNLDQLFLFGYSAGGIIVQEYAIQFPNHLKGVILSGGYPKIDTDILKKEHVIGIYMAEHFPKLLAKILSISHFSEKNLQEEMYEHILKANKQIWATFYKESLCFNCLDRITQLHAPLMLLYGTRADSINHHVGLYPKIIDTEVHFISGAGHQLPTKKSKKVNSFIQQFVRKFN
ncbi:MAG: alpha/beta fold hydrolase [Heyndrickxia sp.]